MGDVIDFAGRRRTRHVYAEQSEPKTTIGEVINLAERRNAHVCDDRCEPVNFLALCLTCLGRWLGTAPTSTYFFGLQCPHCESQDSFVSVLPDWYYFINGDKGPDAS